MKVNMNRMKMVVSATSTKQAAKLRIQTLRLSCLLT